MNPIIPCSFLMLLLISCDRYTSGGGRMYMTGMNDRGETLKAEVDRSSLSNKATVLSCAKCHGEDRTGRTSGIPEFGPYRAPDITRAALLSAGPEKRPAYDRTTLAEAITLGRNPNGKGLHYPMPRWALDRNDLDKLLDYLLEPEK